jgi:hypothetical protein
MTISPAAPPEAHDELPEPVYDNVQDWVSDHFIPIYRRPIGGEYRWCPQWWRHAEAIERLTALWQSWEAMRLQPGTGTANWLRDHLDHQLPVLLGRSGPFAQCGEDEHITPRAVAAEQPPLDWWDDGSDETVTNDDTGGTPLPPGQPGGGAPDDEDTGEQP